ncbi:M16 family metallopeptidase [Herminiimonas fonticola]|uniref:Zinc protease n=1 Tax=Herminiimonas fonticola TaxID=303380 RepID=A0A4R6GIN7_9BURK|nr:pitrilysin family protein [Herminiimonas fonticola]RBA25029.1 putative Zn-dependent peptidase [Herminiimonas fonticola]TDN94144.1 zinc protease [Herminiimonas fonticola]
MFKTIVGLVLCAACSISHAALQIQSWNLPNGARVLFVENHTIPILDLSVDFDAGSRRDPAGKSGVAALTSAMLARGIRAVPASNEPALTEAQISDAFADTAALRGARLDDDRSGVTLRTLVSEREIAVPLVGRLLAEPSFPQDFLSRDKARTIASIKEGLTQPEAIADKAFSRLLYGDHPYGQQLTVESVTAITRDDLLAFHATHYVANRAVVALIGDVTREQADKIAQELTRRLPQGAALPALPAVPVAKGREERIPHQATQAHILIGMPAMARHDPDHFALTVGNYVLGGGGFASRLMQQVREKRGLTYGVSSYFNPMAQAGPFQIGLQTKKEQANEALKVTRDTVAEFLRDGPTPVELKAAKDNLIGGFSLRIDSNKKILENIAAIGFYQLPLDYLDTWTAKVAAVTAAQVKDAFNRKLQMDKLSTVVVGADTATDK